MNPVEQLIEKAFHTGPAIEANLLIHGVRQRIKAQYGCAYNYEVSLLDRSWDEVCPALSGRFKYYLRSHGFDVRRCEPVFVSLFYQAQLYFIRARDFLGALERTDSIERTSDSMREVGQSDESLSAETPLLPVPVEKK